MRRATLALALATTGSILTALAGCEGGGASEGASSQSTTQDLLARQDELEQDLSALGVNFGNPQAPVLVIEMSDYGCGYCRQFHVETFPSLRDEYVAPGKVGWKFVPYVTGAFEHSEYALTVAECTLEQSGPGFVRLDRRLWEEQAEWKQSTDPEPVLRAWVEELAPEVQLDLERFDSCMSEGRPAERIASANLAARQLGTRGTPTFYVLGFPPIQGALPLDVFREVLDSVYVYSIREGEGTETEGGAGQS